MSATEETPTPQPKTTTTVNGATTIEESPHAPLITNLPHGLEIRRWHPSDAPSCAHHANNFKIWLNMTNTYPFPYTIESAHKWIEFSADKSNWMHDESDLDKPPISASYAVLKEGICIGSIGLKPKKDIEHRACEVGYWLGEEYWGMGYMPILLRAFVDWTWRTFPALVRLEAVVIAWNAQSGKVLKKAGFELEGIKKKSVFKDGKIVNSETWATFREDSA